MSQTRKITFRRVNYGIWTFSDAPRFWFRWWTPRWHEGRGPYISIGLGWFAIGRGY